MRKYLFSIFCFLVAIIIPIHIALGCFLWANDDDFIYSLLIINCITPCIMLVVIGYANLPKKDKKERNITNEKD